jgi:hypothetical protein
VKNEAHFYITFVSYFQFVVITIQQHPLDYLPGQCFFRILAPPGQKIQFTCPIVNSTTSTVQVKNHPQFLYWGSIDVDTNGSSLMRAARPVLNRVYTSERNSMLFTYKFVQGDSLDCNWTTIPPSTTTDFKRDTICILHVFEKCSFDLKIFRFISVSPLANNSA